MGRNRNRNQAKRAAGERPSGTFVDVDINEDDQQQASSPPVSSPQQRYPYGGSESPIMQPKPTRAFPYRSEEDEGEAEEYVDAEDDKPKQQPAQSAGGWTGFLFGGGAKAPPAKEGPAAPSPPYKPKRSSPPPPAVASKGFTTAASASASGTANPSSAAKPTAASTNVNNNPATTTTTTSNPSAPKPATTGWNLWGSKPAAAPAPEELKTSPKVSPRFGSPVAAPPPPAPAAATGFKPSSTQRFGVSPGATPAVASTSAYTYPAAPPPSKAFATAGSKRPADIETGSGGRRAPFVGQAFPPPPKGPTDAGQAAAAPSPDDGKGSRKSLWLTLILILGLLAIILGVIFTVAYARPKHRHSRPRMVANSMPIQAEPAPEPTGDAAPPSA
jgi:hypothetical protein